MAELFSLLAFLFPVPDMTGPVAVHAAYVIHTQQADTPSQECCGECNGTGFITHGDGHRTPCPCPPGCECKRPAAVLKCEDGSCKK